MASGKRISTALVEERAQFARQSSSRAEQSVLLCHSNPVIWGNTPACISYTLATSVLGPQGDAAD